MAADRRRYAQQSMPAANKIIASGLREGEAAASCGARTLRRCAPKLIIILVGFCQAVIIGLAFSWLIGPEHYNGRSMGYPRVMTRPCQRRYIGQEYPATQGSMKIAAMGANRHRVPRQAFIERGAVVSDAGRSQPAHANSRSESIASTIVRFRAIGRSGACEKCAVLRIALKSPRRNSITRGRYRIRWKPTNGGEPRECCFAEREPPQRDRSRKLASSIGDIASPGPPNRTRGGQPGGFRRRSEPQTP